MKAFGSFVRKLKFCSLNYFSIFLIIGTRPRDRGSVITPLITSINASEILNKLPLRQLDRPCPAEMISLWKWVQVFPWFYLVWEKEPNGICGLSFVTHNTILCYSNPPGAPGAAYVHCSGDWASDWSRFHSGPWWSCPAGTQGATLTIWPCIPSLLVDLWITICEVNFHIDSSLMLFLPGNPASQLLRTTHCGISWPGF